MRRFCKSQALSLNLEMHSFHELADQPCQIALSNFSTRGPFLPPLDNFASVKTFS
ncbi:MAG: hypothetical protein RJB66_1864 [Pseudomonadota bacterium]